MPTLICPTCKKTDKVPDKYIGARLKCKVCGTSILVTAQGAEAVPVTAPAAAAAAPAAAPVAAAKSGTHAAFSGIEVEGLDSTAWSAVPEPPPGVAAETPEQTRHDSAVRIDSTPATERPPGTKEYKLLTPRDRCFEGKFELSRLEEALNAYARQGWIVRSMVTPLVPGFTGGPKEELVVLLER